MSVPQMWALMALYAASVGTTFASAPLPASELYESCAVHLEAPESPEALVCASYIRGYLDSARAGAELLTQRANQPAAPETWEERAARTRLGKSYLEELRKRDSRFCLSESVTLEDIVAQLMAYLRMHPPAQRKSAAEALASTLRLHHPCGR